MISTLSPMMLLALVLGTCMASGVLLVGFRWAPERQIRAAARHWFIGITSVPVGWVLLEWAISGGPSWLFLLGKPLIMGAFVEFLRAVRRLRSDVQVDRGLHVLTALVLLSTLVWMLGWPDVTIRSSLLSLLCAGIALWVGYESWSETNRRTSSFALVAGIGLALAAATLLLRAIQYAAPVAGLDHLLPALPPGLLLGVLLSALVLATLGFALLLSDVHLRVVSMSTASAGTTAGSAVMAPRRSRAGPLDTGRGRPLA